jgi:pyruvate dehydrogenase E1 component
MGWNQEHCLSTVYEPLLGPNPDNCMKYDADTIQQITSRAFSQMNAMIYLANHRDNTTPGDPKVGGHPASCSSCMELMTAVHLIVREPQDYVCCKPHASPTDHALHHLMGLNRHPDGRWFDDSESEAVMHRLRDFSHDGKAVFQSYHAEADPDHFHFLPSGSVGIPPVMAAYLSLAHRYAQSHGWEVPDPHFWCMMGDSEFREGSLLEVLPEVAERELGNVTWLVDYNRQNLDGTRIPTKRGLRGTDADRIERTCKANGWEVIQVRHGRFRQQIFERAGGDNLRWIFEDGLSDYHYQMLIWKNDAAELRQACITARAEVKPLVDSLSDEEVLKLFHDVGGHDMEILVKALRAAKANTAVPCILIVHTIKGRGLECSAAPGNHSALPSKDEVGQLLAAEGLDWDRPFTKFDPDSAAGQWLQARGSEMRAAVEQHEVMKAENLARVAAQLDEVGGVPESLDINLKLVPIAHTQWMWGQAAAKLVRIGVHDELMAAGKNAGKTLSESEARWGPVADLILTMAPDVGTSTNINPAMDEKVYGPDSETNWEKKLDLRERLRPELSPTDEAWTRHIRFEIAEANCMSAAGSFGKMSDLLGIPYLPMMTVYDFFIKRALDQLYYNLYWGSGFILVGTPSGVTLSSEGAQHSWKSDIQVPNLVTWEPSFAQELDWILCDAIQRHVTHNNQNRKAVLVRGVTRGLPQDQLIKNLRRQTRFKNNLPEGALLGARSGDGGLVEAEAPSIPDSDIFATLRTEVLQGGYRLIDFRGYQGYQPGENVINLFVMGALAPEALAASEQLLDRGIYANVIVTSSPSLLFGLQGREDNYTHLREGLGIDGTLHLSPTGQVQDRMDVVDLAGRRIPVVSVHDGEEGLLDNIGSIIGSRQISLAVRRFSKCGTPDQIYNYQSLGTDSIVEACGQALAESALERVQVTSAALEDLRRNPAQNPGSPNWKELWPDPV